MRTIKARHVEYIDVEMSEQAIIEEACKILYAKHNLPYNSFLYEGKIVLWAGNFKEVIGEPTEREREVLEIIDVLNRWGWE